MEIYAVVVAPVVVEYPNTTQAHAEETRLAQSPLHAVWYGVAIVTPLARPSQKRVANVGWATKDRRHLSVVHVVMDDMVVVVKEEVVEEMDVVVLLVDSEVDVGVTLVLDDEVGLDK